MGDSASEEPKKGKALERALDIGEAALGNVVGAAGALAGDPNIGLAAAVFGPGLAGLMRQQIEVLIAELRYSRAEHFTAVIQSETDMTGDELRERIEARPMRAQLLEEGLEAALRSAGEEKRILLGKVVAAAFRCPDDAQPR